MTRGEVRGKLNVRLEGLAGKEEDGQGRVGSGWQGGLKARKGQGRGNDRGWLVGNR